MEPRKDLVVVALGGNAFQSKGERGTYEEYLRNASYAAKAVAYLVEKGLRVVVTHGNGPQVGVLLEWMERGKNVAPPMPMDVANAMTQGWLGYVLMQAITRELSEKGLANRVKGVVSLVTRVVVDPRDPAFSNPTKFVGPYYSEEEARKLANEKGWVMKPDPRGGWRRVVPSPNPLDVVEWRAVEDLVNSGWIVIAVGGGGIPVVRENSWYRGVEAVIDKDLASATLAIRLRASRMFIFTDVDYAYVDFGKPTAKPIKEMTIEEAKRLLEQGVFGEGSMAPKIRAAVRFVENGGEEARIGHLRLAEDVIEGRSGTRIVARR